MKSRVTKRGRIGGGGEGEKKGRREGGGEREYLLFIGSLRRWPCIAQSNPGQSQEPRTSDKSYV